MAGKEQKQAEVVRELALEKAEQAARRLESALGTRLEVQKAA
ncbi:MAG: hypothetical protein WCH37_01695 [Synechococcaceae cyanobacterium ELA182]